LSAQTGDRAVDDVDVETAWKALQSQPRSQLVDVRTRAEWTYVGIPDLGPVGKRTVLVEWQTFPDQAVDPRFAERLAGELKALGVKEDDELFFICRSGSRSMAAAKAMAAAAARFPFMASKAISSSGNRRASLLRRRPSIATRRGSRTPTQAPACSRGTLLYRNSSRTPPQ